ncbi:TPA: hypothetical protein MH561_17595 [Klebsiella pneumoniae]|nr:hypothetical protein [Klebsiella pneumoniae]HBX5814795.1 hypothetical protein [Klebsiella pneumoniae]
MISCFFAISQVTAPVLRYRLAENHTDPGTSVYDWNAAGSFITEKTFNDVDEAFQSLNMGAFR